VLLALYMTPAIYSIYNQVPAYSKGRSQTLVNWEGCGRKGIQHKIVMWDVGWFRCHLCGCCKPASGHTVTGESGRVPATNQGPVKSRRVFFWYWLTRVVLEKVKMVVVAVFVVIVVYLHRYRTMLHCHGTPVIRHLHFTHNITKNSQPVITAVNQSCPSRDMLPSLLNSNSDLLRPPKQTLNRHLSILGPQYCSPLLMQM